MWHSTVQLETEGYFSIRFVLGHDWMSFFSWRDRIRTAKAIRIGWYNSLPLRNFVSQLCSLHLAPDWQRLRWRLQSDVIAHSVHRRLPEIRYWLRNWDQTSYRLFAKGVSPDEEGLANVPESQLAKSLLVYASDSNFKERVPGIAWNVQSDECCFSTALLLTSCTKKICYQ